MLKCADGSWYDFEKKDKPTSTVMWSKMCMNCGKNHEDFVEAMMCCSDEVLEMIE